MSMRDLDAELEDLGVTATKPLPPLKEIRKPPHAQWERCKQWIAEGIEGSLLSLADIERLLEEGTAILWPGKQCAIVTEFVDYSNGERAAQVLSAGGELEEIRSMVPGMEAFARLSGCAQIVVEGRKGWEKVLGPTGYKFLSIKIVKVLG
jgi:hypothetical protein